MTMSPARNLDTEELLKKSSLKLKKVIDYDEPCEESGEI